MVDIIIPGTDLPLSALVESAVVLAQATYNDRYTIDEETLFRRFRAIRDIKERHWRGWDAYDNSGHATDYADALWEKSHDDIVAAMYVVSAVISKDDGALLNDPATTVIRY